MNLGKDAVLVTYTAQYDSAYEGTALQMSTVYGEVWIKQRTAWKLLWAQETKVKLRLGLSAFVDHGRPTDSSPAFCQTPPKHRYLISRYSSIPYFEPSRPSPDSFTPPNGATSVEINPVLIPTIPYSSPSATRQIRAMSRP